MCLRLAVLKNARNGAPIAFAASSFHMPRKHFTMQSTGEHSSRCLFFMLEPQGFHCLLHKLFLFPQLKTKQGFYS